MKRKQDSTAQNTQITQNRTTKNGKKGQDKKMKDRIRQTEKERESLKRNKLGTRHLA